MIKLKLRRWHALAALLSFAVIARVLPLDAAVSASPDPDAVMILDTAMGAVCDDHAAISGQPRGAPFAASYPGMLLSSTAPEVHFVALQDTLNGERMDTPMLIPCPVSEAPSGVGAASTSLSAVDEEGAAMVMIFAAWLSPPPTLPPLPKPTATPTPAPPLAVMAFVPAVSR